MKTFKILILFLMMIQLTYQTARAEQLQAIVTTVYEGGQSLIVTVSDQMGNTENNIRFYVRPGASLRGLDSLDDLAVGDLINVEAQKLPVPEDNTWQVTSIEKGASNV